MRDAELHIRLYLPLHSTPHIFCPYWTYTPPKPSPHMPPHAKIFRFLAAFGQDPRPSKPTPYAKQSEPMPPLIKTPFNLCGRWWNGIAAVESTWC